MLTGTEKLRGPWPALAALFVVAAALVLLVPPVTIFCSIFAVVLKYRNHPESDEEEDEGRDGRR